MTKSRHSPHFFCPNRRHKQHTILFQNVERVQNVLVTSQNFQLTSQSSNLPSPREPFCNTVLLSGDRVLDPSNIHQGRVMELVALPRLACTKGIQ
ncbi:hypothetical protein BaRGS_00021309 [Batillaria attramentaria]|uniref:Uncharacterized protein n=1 Tax=Batillaria attramentaria TaxID=370345 RepID=A0ABD0KK26_9CAEN